MNAFINGISYYLPDKVVTNQQLSVEFPEWSVEKIANKIGINNRHIAAENETSLDMAISAVELFFHEHSNINKKEIDFVLYCTQSPDYFLPTTACILQDKVGLSKSCGALDFNLGCSGYIYGLSLAKGLIYSKTASNVLLITSETYSKHIHPKDKNNRTIFGDAATVTLISNKGEACINEFSLGTDGSGANNLIVKSGGVRQPNKTNKIEFDDAGIFRSEDYLYMNGTEIFNFTLEAVPKLVNDVLQKNLLEPTNIDLYVFHQANRYMMEFLRKKMKIDPSLFYYYMEECGNTVSSTIPIALKEAMKEGKIKYGSKVLIAGFGVGYSWGATVLQY